jgi:hypothetical protein
MFMSKRENPSRCRHNSASLSLDGGVDFHAKIAKGTDTRNNVLRNDAVIMTFSRIEVALKKSVVSGAHRPPQRNASWNP